MFDPIRTGCVFDLETERFFNEIVPLELVNYSLKKDGNNHGPLFSYEKDGASNYTWRIYRWELSDATLDFMQVYDVNTIEFSDGCPVRELGQDYGVHPAYLL